MSSHSPGGRETQVGGQVGGEGELVSRVLEFHVLEAAEDAAQQQQRHRQQQRKPDHHACDEPEQTTHLLKT